MDGLITLFVFVVALNKGGWYWLAFVLILGKWVVKLQVKKVDRRKIPKTPDDIENGLPLPNPISGRMWPPPPTPIEKGSPVPRPTLSQSPCASDDWIDKLTEVCSRYTSPSYYVAELIPRDKLQNALKTYPLNDGGNPIALIDATFFGSAKNGMLIGEYGLSWHHSLGNCEISTMPWAKFSELAITVDGSKIKIGNDAVFETSGTSFEIKKIVTLLELIGDTWTKSLVSDENSPENETEISQPMSLPPFVPKKLKLDRVDVNIADFDSLLALPGIGAADAKIIVKHIQSNGPLVSIDEMSVILNLKPHIVERLRPLVTFSTTKRGPLEPPKPIPPADPAAAQHPLLTRTQGPVRAPIDF